MAAVRSRGLLISLVAAPLALALLIPVSAAAADDQPVPGSAGAVQEPGDEPTEPPPTDRYRGADVPAEEATPTEEPDPPRNREPTEEPTIPPRSPRRSRRNLTYRRPRSSPTMTAAQQVVGDPEPKVTICHRTADRDQPLQPDHGDDPARQRPRRRAQRPDLQPRRAPRPGVTSSRRSRRCRTGRTGPRAGTSSTTAARCRPIPARCRRPPSARSSAPGRRPASR